MNATSALETGLTWLGVGAVVSCAVSAVFAGVMIRYGRKRAAYERRMALLGLSVNPCHWCRTHSEPTDPHLHELEHQMLTGKW